MKLVVGTRASKLARCQTEQIVGELQKIYPDIDVEYRLIQTEGDRRFDENLKNLGGKGAFTSALDNALRDGEIDLAVHSYKDLPSEELTDSGLCIAAVPKRADAADWLVARQPIDLSEKREWKIGTSSARRKCQLLKQYPHIKIMPIRGNITTRVQKLLKHDFDGIILAAAGIQRLNLSVPWFQPFDDSVMLPAPAQGALALIARSDDQELLKRLKSLNDPETKISTDFERRALKITGGGCDAPIGARCTTYAGHFILNLRVFFSDNTSDCWEHSVSGKIPDSLDQIFLNLEEEFNIAKEKFFSKQPNGSNSSPDKKQKESSPRISKHKLTSEGNLHGKRIAVTRDEDADGELCLAIRRLNGEPISVPLIEIVPREESDALVKTLKKLPYGSWIIFASKRSVELLTSLKDFSEKDFKKQGLRIATVGEKTSAFIRKCNLTPEVISREGGADDLIGIFERTQEVAGETIFLPQSSQSLSTLKVGFQKLRANVVTEVLYDVNVQKMNAQLLCQMIEKCQLDALTFCSPSAVEAFRVCWGPHGLPASLRVASIGETTSTEVLGKGWTVHAEAEKPSVENVAKALADFYAEKNNPSQSAATD